MRLRLKVLISGQKLQVIDAENQNQIDEKMTNHRAKNAPWAKSGSTKKCKLSTPKIPTIDTNESHFKKSRRTCNASNNIIG